jgi:hypothetical protein
MNRWLRHFSWHDTLPPQFGLEKKIDFLVDDDPRKGSVMAGPGYDIPILRPAALYERKAVVAIVWARRHVDPIRQAVGIAV